MWAPDGGALVGDSLAADDLLEVRPFLMALGAGGPWFCCSDRACRASASSSALPASPASTPPLLLPPKPLQPTGVVSKPFDVRAYSSVQDSKKEKTMCSLRRQSGGKKVLDDTLTTGHAK